MLICALIFECPFRLTDHSKRLETNPTASSASTVLVMASSATTKSTLAVVIGYSAQWLAAKPPIVHQLTSSLAKVSINKVTSPALRRFANRKTVAPSRAQSKHSGAWPSGSALDSGRELRHSVRTIESFALCHHTRFKNPLPTSLSGCCRLALA